MRACGHAGWRYTGQFGNRKWEYGEVIYEVRPETVRGKTKTAAFKRLFSVIPARFERAAYCLEGSCSIRLSYWREFWMEQVTRIELASPAWKAGALAIVLHPRVAPAGRASRPSGRAYPAAANRQLCNHSTLRPVCQYPRGNFLYFLRNFHPPPPALFPVRLRLYI